LKGITKNFVFFFVIIGIFVLQILLVTFGGTAFGVYNNFGLRVQHWLISIGIGSISIVVNFILKLLPIAKPHPSETDTSTGEVDNKIVPAPSFRRRSVLSLKRIE